MLNYPISLASRCPNFILDNANIFALDFQIESPTVKRTYEEYNDVVSLTKFYNRKKHKYLLEISVGRKIKPTKYSPK